MILQNSRPGNSLTLLKTNSLWTWKLVAYCDLSTEKRIMWGSASCRLDLYRSRLQTGFLKIFWFFKFSKNRCFRKIKIKSQQPKVPTNQPTEQPTVQPTEQPTQQPTQQPSEQPTEQPTDFPTWKPTIEPTFSPSEQTFRKSKIWSEFRCFFILKSCFLAVSGAETVIRVHFGSVLLRFGALKSLLKSAIFRFSKRLLPKHPRCNPRGTRTFSSKPFLCFGISVKRRRLNNFVKFVQPSESPTFECKSLEVKIDEDSAPYVLAGIYD